MPVGKLCSRSRGGKACGRNLRYVPCERHIRSLLKDDADRMKEPSLTLGIEEEYQVVDPETG
ncbi:MAG: hypothetical protein R3344_11405, partial [Acidobacteriota bacterium]|nr:hypothetical protein [Acidobacteriota bacterium]